MKKSTEWIVLNKRIRAAEKARGIKSDDHAALVEAATGKASLGQCTLKEMWAVLNMLNGHHGGQRSHKAYVRKIWAIWGAMNRAGMLGAKDTRQALVAYVNKITGAAYTDPRQLDWLTYDKARRVIEALKAWMEREGKGHGA